MSTPIAPAFQWYPKDALASARLSMMTLAEEGAYRRALDYCWINGFLPVDTKQLAMLIGKGCNVKTAERVKEMFVEHEGKLYHERLDQEREKQLSYKASKSEAGKIGMKKRWEKRKGDNNKPITGDNSVTDSLITNDNSSSPVSSLQFSSPDIPPEGGTPDPPKKEQPKKGKLKKAVSGKPELLFTESEFADFAKFEAAFAGDKDYQLCDLRYYYERAKNWSEGSGAKKRDWIATVRNFMLGDACDNKLKLKPGTKLQDGNKHPTTKPWDQ